MKFNYPYHYKDRVVLIQDGVLFIPTYYDQYDSFQFPSWDDPLVFGNASSVVVEYCSGNGEWIVEKAKERPSVNFVAVERRFDRVSKLWARREKNQIKNLFIVFGEALTATKYYFPADSICEVYVNFPDPWPKKKHAKHRLITDSFVSEIKRITKADGTVTLATDDHETSSRIINCFLKEFHSDFPEPFYVNELDGFGRSFFQTLWLQKGGNIHYHRFINQFLKCD